MLGSVFILCGILSNGIFAWESLPDIPTGRRSEYYALNENGQYKYGYDTGDGIAAKQSGDASNQVKGHYFYKLSNGNDFDLKYSAGVQGFVPEELSNKISNTGATEAFRPTGGSLSISNDSPSENPTIGIQPESVSKATAGTLAYGSLNLDGSYAFGFKTDDQSRQESADAANNVQGSYSYKNTAGTHDLSYVAGSETGFKPTGGSLSIPNGLANSAGNNSPSGGLVTSAAHSGSSSGDTSGTLAYGSLKPDGSYAFGFKTNDQSRQESADASNNVQGSYLYQNSAGIHDLSYIAGSQTGFKPIGGSLSIPNSLPNLASQTSTPGHPITGVAQPASSIEAAAGTLAYGSLNADGSYSYRFKTNDQSKQESADANNNAQGSYSYKNSAGTHDLFYVAGSEIGFKPTGGSLSTPNGLLNSAGNNFHGASSLEPAAGTLAYGTLNSDGSYAFNFKTNEQSRQESADAHNNVHGSYSYENSAGTHDLSYIAGSGIGFKPTGGSLSNPNGLPNLSNSNNVQGGSTLPFALSGSVGKNAVETLAYGSLNPDGSYAFDFQTKDQSRKESADANNNVEGNYSYKNAAGTHDLSYVAGAETGFKPTGGSLSIPNGLQNSMQSEKNGISSSTSVQFGLSSPNTAGTLAHSFLNPDGSYSFGFNTENQSRQEASDIKSNVQGSYLYRNSAGTHDLSYVAGETTGFKPVGGTLSIPNGLSKSTALQGDIEENPTGSNLPQIDGNGRIAGSPETKFSYKIGNLAVHTYLPPSNEKHKFGYIFDTKH